VIERVAYHEAGHAAVAVHQGLGLRLARLATEPVVLTDCRRNRRPGACVDERVIFLTAGFYAERRFDCFATREANSMADFDRALGLLGGRREPALRDPGAQGPAT
jgi:hypothetical protein